MIGKAAPAWQAILAMTVTELRLTIRRGEILIAGAVLPLVMLIFFSSIAVIPTNGRPAVDFFLPSSIAFSIIASSLVSLGITTAYDRFYGVLKRLGGSPLSRADLIASKLIAVLVVEAVQIGVLVAAARLLLGWSLPEGASLGLLLVGVLIGTFTFAGLALLLAGTLRAETVLAVANGLFVASLVFGGIAVPIHQLPAPLAAIAGVLPAAALSETLQVALAGSGEATGSLALLAGWGVVAVGLAVATFRWE